MFSTAFTYPFEQEKHRIEAVKSLENTIFLDFSTVSTGITTNTTTTTATTKKLKLKLKF